MYCFWTALLVCTPSGRPGQPMWEALEQSSGFESLPYIPVLIWIASMYSPVIASRSYGCCFWPVASSFQLTSCLLVRGLLEQVYGMDHCELFHVFFGSLQDLIHTLFLLLPLSQLPGYSGIFIVPIFHKWPSPPALALTTEDRHSKSLKFSE